MDQQPKTAEELELERKLAEAQASNAEMRRLAEELLKKKGSAKPRATTPPMPPIKNATDSGPVPPPATDSGPVPPPAVAPTPIPPKMPTRAPLPPKPAPAPKPEATPTPKTEEGTKAETLATLRKTIADAQEIIEKNRRRQAEIAERLAELDREIEDEKRIEEDREKNPLKHFLIERLHPMNFKILFGWDRENFGNLEVLQETDRIMGDGRTLTFWNRKDNIAEKFNYEIESSSNGFYLSLINFKEAPRDEKGIIQLYDPRARYKIYRPDGTLEADDLDYHTGEIQLEQKAQEYQDKMLALFESQGREK